jgi:hypothetical protein
MYPHCFGKTFVPETRVLDGFASYNMAKPGSFDRMEFLFASGAFL